MTKIQVDYENYLENQRHNKEMETISAWEAGAKAATSVGTLVKDISTGGLNVIKGLNSLFGSGSSFGDAISLFA